jgi:exopolysaccharide biosynthesis WecB/TagA/CpsF family protein
MTQWRWQKRWKTLIGKLEVVGDDAAAQRLLDRLAAPSRATVLGFVNAHAMNLVVRDGSYCQALTAADVLLRDGSGMAILYRRLGLEPGRNMNGTDFIPKLMAAYRGRRVAFWGTRRPYLNQAVQRSEALFGVVPVSVHDGFASVETYLALARQQQPELIVLGMGMPKQEAVAARLAAIGGPCVIVCGGAILDFLGGKVSRAPGWLRRMGGEWVYRLLREPKRLFLRYVVGNPLFLLRTLMCRRAVVSAR